MEAFFYIIPGVLYALAGFLMKLSDDAHDRRKNDVFAIFTGFICALCIVYLAVTSADAACIFVAILIGNLLAWKIDSINHVVSFLILVGILAFLGIPSIGIVTLAVCAGAAFVDEIGNDNPGVSKWGRAPEFFFEHRFTLKIAVLAFAVLGLFQASLPQFAGVQYFQIQTFVYFLMFEVFYEVAASRFDAIYDGLYSVFGAFR